MEKIILIVGISCLIFGINELSGTLCFGKVGIPKFKKGKFRIRFIPWWASPSSFLVEYTNNYGFTWNRILGFSEGYNDYESIEITYDKWSIGMSKQKIFNMFNSIQNIKSYNKEVRNKVKRLNKERTMRKNQINKNINDFYNETTK